MTTDKRKKRKPTKLEQLTKLVEAVPAKDRWWTPWMFEPSDTVSGFVSETPQGSVTEEIWDSRVFEQRMKAWMVGMRDHKSMQPALFNR